MAQVSKHIAAAQLFRARRICAAAFAKTLRTLNRRPNITEIQFRDTWVSYIASNPEMTSFGWYTPPPGGVAVLAGKPSSARRLSFTSLRDPQFYPSNEKIDWDDGFLFAYCSHLSQ